MLLVLLNAVVMGLLVVTIIQGYEIKNLKSEINQIKLVQVVTTIKKSGIDFTNLKETIEKKLKEEVDNERESKV